MAIVECNGCGQEVSDKTKTCPNCGVNFTDINEKNKETKSNQPAKKKRGFWGVVKCILFWAFIVFMALFAFGIYLNKSGYNPEPKVKATEKVIPIVEPKQEQKSLPPVSEVATSTAQETPVEKTEEVIKKREPTLNVSVKDIVPILQKQAKQEEASIKVTTKNFKFVKDKVLSSFSESGRDENLPTSSIEKMKWGSYGTAQFGRLDSNRHINYAYFSLKGSHLNTDNQIDLDWLQETYRNYESWSPTPEEKNMNPFFNFAITLDKEWKSEQTMLTDLYVTVLAFGASKEDTIKLFNSLGLELKNRGPGRNRMRMIFALVEMDSNDLHYKLSYSGTTGYDLRIEPVSN